MLSPGSTLGPYAVTAKIGEGGMGEVYRARDTKLDRDVALKVLPQAFTDDPDRLARFEREGVHSLVYVSPISPTGLILPRLSAKADPAEALRGPTAQSEGGQNPEAAAPSASGCSRRRTRVIRPIVRGRYRLQPRWRPMLFTCGWRRGG